MLSIEREDLDEHLRKAFRQEIELLLVHLVRETSKNEAVATPTII